MATTTRKTTRTTTASKTTTTKRKTAPKPAPVEVAEETSAQDLPLSSREEMKKKDAYWENHPENNMGPHDGLSDSKRSK